jgi:hypothetical protein
VTVCPMCGQCEGTDLALSEKVDLLKWVYAQTRDALFTKGNGKKASEIRDAALSAINHKLAPFR